MAADRLTLEARIENLRTLMSAAGLEAEEATERLAGTVLVTHQNDDEVVSSLVREIISLLKRTLPVSLAPSSERDFVLEVIVGQTAPRLSGRRLYVGLDESGITMSGRPVAHQSVLPHPLLTTIAACYVAGNAIFRAAGEGLPNPPPEPLVIEYAEFGVSPADLDQPLDLGEAFLAGAGAIGNGFLWAARQVDLRGTLHLVDDDQVSSSNLQRQVWFDTEDLGLWKSEVLCRKAQPHMRGLNLVPAVCRLQEHSDNVGGRWLRRLIVAVDSRPARRELQNELPGEVFDASTTAAKEIVIHTNRQLSGLACMGCVYPRDEQEVSHEEVVAAHLGLDPADVRTERISPGVAERICRKHPQLEPSQLDGLAFDTLYKQLCSSGQLQTQAGDQVIAPFAFVSVLAGALLVLELYRQLRLNGKSPTNEWRVSPWHAPFGGERYRRPQRAECECCGRTVIVIQQIAQQIWGSSGGVG